MLVDLAEHEVPVGVRDGAGFCADVDDLERAVSHRLGSVTFRGRLNLTH
jgi:hypothetical protein